MSNVRVSCPECKWSFPISIDTSEFSCPRCGRQIHIVSTGKALGWYVDPGSDLYQAQMIRPIHELLVCNPRGHGSRTDGAARARKLIRDQRRRNSHLNPARLMASFFVLVGLVGWYMFNPVIGAASNTAYIPVTGQNTFQAPVVSPSVQTTNDPAKTPIIPPTSTPTPTATPLPALLVQATERQAAIDQAIANSYIQETANSARYQATQTAISVRFTEVAGARQADATATARAKNSP